MISDLKTKLQIAGISQGDLCRETGLSKATVHRIVNTGQYPRRGAAMYQNAIAAMLAKAVFPRPWANDEPTKNKTPGTPHAKGLSVDAQSAPTVSPTTIEKEDPMLLRKQTITQATRQHFKLFKDPFNNDVQEAKDVFLTPDIRYVRETLWVNVRHGGMTAVIGESGSGKSTIRADMADRIVREQISAIMIEPYVLEMEENDSKGKTLKSASISEAIITAISPLASLKRGAQARSKQLHTMLTNSSRAGNRHIIVIEEAHCLPKPTLKHLKRFFELKDGFKEVLSVVLIGQPELRQKLSEKDPEVREVAQRCDIVELPPLDNNLEAYLKFKLERVGGTVDTVFDKGAIDAIRSKLTFNASASKGRAFGQAQQGSLLYPLAVANLVAASMNLAVSIGAPLVTADLVMEA